MTPGLETPAFPDLLLPLPIPYPPMEATRATTLPEGEQWQFEPKWDGFRCLVFRWQDDVVLQSKAGQPLARYFPELVAAFRALPPQAFALDGEIVLPVNGVLSFDDLLHRIHPAESRINKLSRETPARYLAFDLLYQVGQGSLVEHPLNVRRAHLERFFRNLPSGSAIELSPSTRDRAVAVAWFKDPARIGQDGVMATLASEPYHSGDREAMIKVKHLKTADCVVGGFRYSGSTIGSLLLGLYDENGLLNFVGHAASFTDTRRRELGTTLEPLKGGEGFTGKAPGGPSRWSAKRNMEWEPLTLSWCAKCDTIIFRRTDFATGQAFFAGGRTKIRRRAQWTKYEHPRQPIAAAILSMEGVGKANSGESNSGEYRTHQQMNGNGWGSWVL